jgi:ribosomal protein L37AE/L43A
MKKSKNVVWERLVKICNPPLVCEKCKKETPHLRSYYHLWVCDKCDQELKDNDPE